MLIGMPGAGKSTLGVLLAKKLGMDFVDTDILIQSRTGKTLQQLLDEKDYLHLRRVEEQVLLDIHNCNAVIATGGSAVYSQAAVAHLKKNGLLVYLQASREILKKRIHDYETRGIAGRPGQCFASLYDERTLLYERYADVTINGNELDIGQLTEVIAAQLVGRC